MEDSSSVGFVDDTELDGMINTSLGIWHGMVVRAVPERYEATDTISANGATSYALPADHLATLGVEYQSSSSEYIDLERVMFHDRNKYGQTTSSMALGYRLSGTAIVLIPAPSSGTYRHVYVTAADVLASDSDTIDGVNGWESWIVYDCAVKMLQKEESDASQVMKDRDRLWREIEAAAVDRELANPKYVVDTRTKRWSYSLGYGQRDPDFWS